jgi:hypothetical protein
MERHENSSRVKELSPETYFQKIADPTFNISMRDARNWEVQIKDCFCSLSYDVQKKVMTEIQIPPKICCARGGCEQLKFCARGDCVQLLTR